MSLNVENLYRTHGPMVMRRCRFLLKNEEAAVDAMQDTFVNLIKNQHRLTVHAPASLLYRMATNVCLNKIRAQKLQNQNRETAVLNTIASYHPEPKLLARAMLESLLLKRNEETRYIAVLYFLDRFSMDEVSAQVGLSVSCIRKRMGQLRISLMKLEARKA